MKFNTYTYYYFVGIGGIGMSALARYALSQNKKVFGYDKTATSLTKSLENEGIEIIFVDEPSQISSECTASNTLVIYTPAIKSSNLLTYFKTHDFTIVKRAEALSWITENSKCIAIAGTHGKTTTTTLLAYLLKETNFPAMAFLGGISENYQTNFIYNDDQYIVVEADEFDKSFLQLRPYFAAITSMDADHLDIYGDAHTFENTFEEFADQIKDEGTLFLKKGLPITHENISYSAFEKADYYSANIQLEAPISSFSLYRKEQLLGNFQWTLHGKHNIENATVALAMAIELGVSVDKLQDALRRFKGIKRRFTTTYFSDGKVYIDDYAHHPTELNAAIDTVNALYPQKKKLFVFQPHLYSRTRDFVEEFAQSLSQTEELLLLEIYPAREEPIEGVTSEWLAEKIDTKLSHSSLAEAMKHIENANFEVLVTLGAGNIDQLIEPIKNHLNHEA